MHSHLTLFQDLKFRITAFDSVVTIVEPEGSWFDLKLSVFCSTTVFMLIFFRTQYLDILDRHYIPWWDLIFHLSHLLPRCKNQEV